MVIFNSYVKLPEGRSAAPSEKPGGADWGNWGWSTFDILDDPGDGCVLVGLLANMAAMEKFIWNSRADVSGGTHHFDGVSLFRNKEGHLALSAGSIVLQDRQCTLSVLRRCAHDKSNKRTLYMNISLPHT